MYATPTYVAGQIARDYTCDRIRDAEARRALRAARMVFRKRRYADAMAETGAPVRRWRLFPADAPVARADTSWSPL